MCKDPAPIEQFWSMQMFGNFGEKRNFIILYFLPPPCLEGADIYRCCKQFSI